VQTLEIAKPPTMMMKKWGEGGDFPHIIDDLKGTGAKLYEERFPLVI
jgi:hypothetical protein